MTPELQEAGDNLFRLKKSIQSVIVGYDQEIEQLMIVLLSGGHALLEGIPGIGKTLLVKSFSQALGLSFGRIQFTPDLMPADITGTNVIMEGIDRNKEFRFQKGPIFNNVILADEINRATPKTQSALLEVMQEMSITAGGVKHDLDPPFIILATQNFVEMEGTYPLPEAQLDRFFAKIEMTMPSLDEMNEIVNRTTTENSITITATIKREEIIRYRSLVRQIPIAGNLIEYANKMVLASHPDNSYSGPLVKQYVKYGASPRAAQAMVLGAKAKALLQARSYVTQQDLTGMLLPVLRHRIILNIEGEVSNISITDIIQEIKNQVQLVDNNTKKILSLLE